MNRRALPDRRRALTFELVHQFLIFQVTIGRFDADALDAGAGGGSLAEVFVSGPKSGEHMHAVVRDAAIMISLALQCGCPVETLRASVSRGDDKQPHSIIGAVLDALAAEEASS